MIYQDAAHQAYRRLKWCQDNRPPAEEIERVRREIAAQERERKIRRLRQSVA